MRPGPEQGQGHLVIHKSAEPAARLEYRLLSMTCRSTCELSENRAYSRLLRGAIGKQIDGMD